MLRYGDMLDKLYSDNDATQAGVSWIRHSLRCLSHHLVDICQGGSPVGSRFILDMLLNFKWHK